VSPVTQALCRGTPARGVCVLSGKGFEIPLVPRDREHVAAARAELLLHLLGRERDALAASRAHDIAALEHDRRTRRNLGISEDRPLGGAHIAHVEIGSRDSDGLDSLDVEYGFKRRVRQYAIPDAPAERHVSGIFQPGPEFVVLHSAP